jgi:hypothetical protein
MNIVFLSIGGLQDLGENTVYPDLLRHFRDQGHSVYVVCQRERRSGLPTEMNIEHGMKVLRVKTGNITKTGRIEKGISTFFIGMQFKKAIQEYFGDVKFDLVLYSTPPITVTKTVAFLKKRDGAASYLMLKDIFPQNACDIGLLKKTGWTAVIYRYFRRKEKQLYLISEMAGIKKMDVETVKSFASRVDDKYRPSYGRVVESHPRQCIIIGTTNNDGGFLRDVTGNRRFWPIRVTGKSKKHPWDLIEKEVEQIWAEAIALFEAGEELYLTGDVAVVASDEQRGAMENDDREGLVVAYLEALLPVNWDTMDIYARQEYFRSPDDPTKPEGTIRRVQVSNMEIWCECFGRHRDALKKTDSYEIEAIINSIGGWERYTGSKTGKKNIPLYGPQKIYVREK